MFHFNYIVLPNPFGKCNSKIECKKTNISQNVHLVIETCVKDRTK